ncbi:MAG: carboxymuconolactone decarboxylase family protein [Gammaproteobacteria bacterium]|nr:carboxymuconolactone decarboxylase family protein [Gammaproteobacteria bacterium]
MTTNGPYLTPLKREDVPELESIFQVTEEYLGFSANDVLTMARLPQATKAYIEFAITVIQEATISTQLIQLITVVASAVSGCRYCTAHSANNCNDAGIDTQKIAAVWDYASSPLFDEKERAALDFAFKAAQSPSALEQSDYDHMQKHFSETEVCEILLVVCQMGFFNRWNDSVATQLEQKPRAFSEVTLPEQHWQIGKHT